MLSLFTVGTGSIAWLLSVGQVCQHGLLAVCLLYKEKPGEHAMLGLGSVWIFRRLCVPWHLAAKACMSLMASFPSPLGAFPILWPPGPTHSALSYWPTVMCHELCTLSSPWETAACLDSDFAGPGLSTELHGKWSCLCRVGVADRHRLPVPGPFWD